MRGRMAKALVELNVKIPERLAPLFEPRRYKILHGGRGGGKSVSVALALLTMGVEKRMRILCTREIQKSLKDSVLKLLADLITEHSLESFYDVQSGTIKGANGTEFIFVGLQDHTVDSIKSYANIDIAWVEEAHSVSANSWQILTPTIRKDGSEIWATFNPDREEDEVYQRFVIKNDPQAWVCDINWRDNPWFPAVLEAERRQLKAVNDDLYQHVWEGQCRSLAGLMFKRAWFKTYDRLPTRLNLYLASDYAVTPDGGDWTEHGVWGLDEDGNLYAVDWWSGQTDPDTWIQAWLLLAKRRKVKVAFEEAGVILRAVDGAINKAMRAGDHFVNRIPLPSAGSKASRALGFAARASAGAVYLPKDSPWGTRLLNQLCAFNGEPGNIDDMVDVCSLIGRGLDDMHDARPAPAKKTDPPKPFTEAFWKARDREAQVDERRKQDYYT